MKFKVGDRVRAIGRVEGVDLTGKTGTVIEIRNTCYDIGVEFDEKFDFGHSCNGNGKTGYCRYGNDIEFELIGNRKIVITTDGKKTLARLYKDNKVIKKATAVCSPDDTFDFATGAKIAFDRLMGTEEKPKYFSGKVVCVRCKYEKLWTVGKIYEVKNGELKRDDGSYITELTAEKISHAGDPENEFLIIKE